MPVDDPERRRKDPLLDSSLCSSQCRRREKETIRWDGAGEEVHPFSSSSGVNLEEERNPANGG